MGRFLYGLPGIGNRTASPVFDAESRALVVAAHNLQAADRELFGLSDGSSRILLPAHLHGGYSLCRCRVREARGEQRASEKKDSGCCQTTPPLTLPQGRERPAGYELYGRGEKRGRRKNPAPRGLLAGGRFVDWNLAADSGLRELVVTRVGDEHANLQEGIVPLGGIGRNHDIEFEDADERRGNL